jgi:PTS system mannose-specific IIA component
MTAAGAPSSGAGAGCGLLILTHGGLASQLLQALTTIVGPVEGARAVSIGWDTPPAEAIEAVRGALAELERGGGVLILTDMFGGTATNLALAFLGEGVEIVTGVNLPMLIRFANRGGSCTLREAADMVRDQGRRAIVVATEYLNTRPAGEGETP